MNSTICPEAYIDNLLIVKSTPSSLMPVSIIEIHMFAYLGCLISLMQGSPISEWGYKFSITDRGFPFSPEIENARKLLIRKGLLLTTEQSYISPNLSWVDSEVNNLDLIHDWSKRKHWLKTATECALTLPIGTIRHLISETPGFESSEAKLNQRKMLLDNQNEIEILYDEYSIIREALEDTSTDLLSPAVLWLSARMMRNTGEVNLD